MNDDMTAQALARLMLDRLGDLATNYAIGDEAMDYLESVRVEIRPIAWPPAEYPWLYETDDEGEEPETWDGTYEGEDAPVHDQDTPHFLA